MSQKVILTKGLIASGKSFWSTEFLKKNKNYKRVNRDYIRHCLSAYTFDDENEKLVQKVWSQVVKEILESGYNLIVDEMNLNFDTRNKNISYIKSIIPNIDIEIKNFPITLEEAITRDKLRSFVIGEKVIKQTWNKYKNELIEMLENQNNFKVVYDSRLQDAVCFDVDGTLALRVSRNPFDYTKVKEDKPIKIVFEQMEFQYSKGREIFVFSGRDGLCYEDTFEWIRENLNNDDFTLCMRKTGDKRRDSIIKKELYEQHIKDKYNLIAVYDDRPQVLNELWRDLGIFTFDVGKGVDF
jgi:predicted kinase